MTEGQSMEGEEKSVLWQEWKASSAWLPSPWEGS